MKSFVCVLDPFKRTNPNYLAAFERLPRSRGLGCRWHRFDTAAVLVSSDDDNTETTVVTTNDYMGVGYVRLDNRATLAASSGLATTSVSDLQLLVALVAERGSTAVERYLGDFAFIVWDFATRTAVAAVDALGVGKLYYTQRDDVVVLASRAEALALNDELEAQYFVELIAQCPLAPGLTPFKWVNRLPAATSADITRGGVRLRRFWSPSHFTPRPLTPAALREAPAECRALLSEAVVDRLSGPGGKWAQLSGGLDSSSIVSTSQWLASKGATSAGLDGTITFVDAVETEADEREYSREVLARWQIRNEEIVEPPFWLDDAVPPPRLDFPKDSLAFYPREHRLCHTVRSAGGRILLAGFGGDELFTGNTIFFADWLARGKVVQAIREMAKWAIAGRMSFWTFAYMNSLAPLLPASLRRARAFEQGRLLPWISPKAARHFDIEHRVFTVTGNHGRLGSKHHDALVASVNAISSDLDAGFIGETLEVRYPFLHRPLVEFALQLPPEVCTRPHERKWVLREAMKGILPEKVRTRVGKGASTDLLLKSLVTQRRVLEPLTRDSILGALGIVDEKKLRVAFETVPKEVYTGSQLWGDIQVTLMVEAWLRLRAGRWP